MTKALRLTVVLSAINVVALIFVIVHGRDVVAQTGPPMLRGRGLELVDAKGQVRAQFNVEPDGEAVFRLRDANGTIRVKLGAGNDGSGLLLIDETTEPGVQIIARRAATTSRPLTTSINLTGADGQRRVIAP